MNLGDLRLSDLATHFQNMYGRRNADFMDGLSERVNWLSIAAGDLQNTIRKKRETQPEEVAADLGRFIGWIFCVVNHFEVMPLEEAMMKKYPASGCSYCGHRPCRCGDDRPDPDLARGSPEQLGWSLIRWQTHLREIYGPRHIQAGLDNVVVRLFKEITEILDVRMSIPDMEYTAEDLEMEFALEITDVLSWACAVANLLNIDLNRALAKHAHACPDCSGVVCTCGRFVARQASTKRLLTRSRRCTTVTPDGDLG